MNASEAIEQGLVKGLHAQGDAVDPARAKELGLVEGDGGRVAFHGPLRGPGEVEPLHRAEDAFPLAQVQERGGAAAKEDRARPEVGGDPFEFSNERADIAIDQLTAGTLGVEGAIETLAHAEGHVDIKTGNWLGSRLGHKRR